jgi:hypothetical protein
MAARLTAIAIAAALALGACETVPAPAPEPTPGGGAMMGETPLALGGDLRRRSVGDVLEAFNRELTARYANAPELEAVADDLRANAFTCAPPSAGGQGEETPALVCRRTETAGDCTHTWQAHLFEAPDGRQLARVRGLYDRRCGGEGLLGGPNS